MIMSVKSMPRNTIKWLFIVFLLSVTSFVYAQQAVTGVVIDDLNEPLLGVNIMVKGTTTGTITDFDGQFSINVDGEAVLVFTYIGYDPVELKVTPGKTVKVKMKESSAMMEEVVVVGYGSQTKATVTGAINSVKSDDLLQTPVANISNALAGRTSGLTAIQQSGEPGQNKSIIKIRGVATLNNGEESDPLVLVDGVERDFNEIDPNEIESINVLKDASATAVFGVRGANGVILVTTKTGHEGKPTISYSSNFAVQTPTRLPKSVDSYTYVMLNNEARENDHLDPIFSPEDVELFRNGLDPIGHPNTDWYAALIKPASFQQQHNINVSGGAKQTRYFMSLGYFEQDGAYRQADLIKDVNGNPSYKRYNFRSNLDFDVTPSTQISVKLGSQFVDSHYSNVSSSDIFAQALSAAPISTPGIIDGKLIKEVEGGWKRVSENPFYSLVGKGWHDDYSNTLNANLSIKQKLDFITKGLSIRAMVSYDGYYLHTLKYTKEVEEYTLKKNIYTTDPEELAANPYIFVLSREEGPISSSESFGKEYKYYAEGAIEYNRTFNGHTVTGLVLANMQKRYHPDLAYGLPTGYLGLVGRVTYNYAHRYLAEVNIGYNGSENFPAGKRFGLFPAYSLGWVVSKEPFWPENKYFTLLKIRGSYGEVGNDKLGGDRYMYRQSVFASTGNYFFGENMLTGKPSETPNYSEGKVGNPDVTWERARKANVGLEMNFFEDRLTFTGDVFYEYRDDILWVREDVPVLVQANLQPANIGIVENKGFELSLGYNGNAGDFNYFVNGNFSFARNKIIEMSEAPQPYPGLAKTGNSVGQIKGLICEGFYNTKEELEDPNRPISAWESETNPLQLGDLKYKDITGDGIIDDNDRTNIGHSVIPEITYGISMGINWKGFDVSMLWQGVGNVSAYFTGASAWPFYSEFRTAFTWHEERWTQERYDAGKKITFPRLSSNPDANQHNYRLSSFWVEDASYIRLKNAEIGYRFNLGEKANKFGLSAIRVFVNGQNLLTFTKMRYFDPEAPSNTQGYYPQMRIFNFGLNVQF